MQDDDASEESSEQPMSSLNPGNVRVDDQKAHTNPQYRYLEINENEDSDVISVD